MLREARRRPREAAWILLLVLLGSVPARAQAPAEERPDLVVLVHGLGRTPLSMLPLELALEREGYEVLNWGYASFSDSIPALATELAREVEEAVRATPGRRVHFVGHSMGNILVRWMLRYRRPPGVGRVVMLAPPNQGARAADRFAPWFGWLLRPLPELRTGEGSTVRSLPPPRDVEIGIIAGSRDSKVSVEETFLPGAVDRVVIPAGHTFIMARPDVRRMIFDFLRTGEFRDEWAETAGPLPSARR